MHTHTPAQTDMQRDVGKNNQTDLEHTTLEKMASNTQKRNGGDYLRDILRRNRLQYINSWKPFIAQAVINLGSECEYWSERNEASQYCLSETTDVAKVRQFISILQRRTLLELSEMYKVLYRLGAGECYETLHHSAIALENAVNMYPYDAESHEVLVDEICNTYIPQRHPFFVRSAQPPPWLGHPMFRRGQRNSEPEANILTTPDNYNPQEIDDVHRACVICQEYLKDHMISPCRHVCLCGMCAKKVIQKKEKCPVCRSAISKIEIVFL